MYWEASCGEGVWVQERGEKVEKTFKERYLMGEIEFEEIDDYSYRWGMSDVEMTLREYVGLNAEEEEAWISTGEEALQEILDTQKG